MKTLKRFLILKAILCGTIAASPAFAEKMNSSTQDSVIERMERISSFMDDNDPAWIASQQRLADLLSERARTRFMSEVEANCDGCKGSKADRQKAIKIYEAVLTKVKINEHGPILFQLGHLYETAGQQDEAIKLYERIVKEAKQKSISGDILARAHASLTDLYFQKGKYKLALENGAIALKNKNLENRGLVIYNMAWSHFNLDHLNEGITTLESLLKNPSLIAKQGPDGLKYDPVFHADIMRDLATFYARRPITAKEIATFEGYIPQGSHKELLLHFASEADRLGQKKAAHDIYARYLEDPSLTNEERLEGFVKLAQVNYDRGDTNQSTQDFAKAAADFQKSCKDADKCKELTKTMKRYVTELHRSKKLKPDADLLNAYLVYSKTFPEDTEMAQRGAQVADSMGKHAVAMQFFRSVSDNKSVSEKGKNDALNNEVSTAEKSNNDVLKKAAYDHYLAVAPKGEQSFKVRYQMAYLDYQQKKLREAASAFYNLAQDTTGDYKLRKQSADLALDSLVQLKLDGNLEEWAWKFAEVLPKENLEYERIARKALMNRVAAIANDKKSSTSELKTALEQVQKAKIAGATAPEKVIYYNNQSVLAQRLGDDNTFLQSSKVLMTLPGVTEARKEEIQGQIISYYEKKLDFKAAYQTALNMKFSKMSTKDKELRLGTLADLAGFRPEKHYRAALKAGLRGEGAQNLRARLVALSGNPVKELKAQAPELRSNPSLLNETVLLVYARTNDKNGLKSVLAMKELRRQSAPGYFQKQELYNELESFKSKIARHQMNGRTDAWLQKTIKERVKLLTQADRLLAESMRMKDVTAQLLALNIIAKENDRTVRDLVALPIPAKLKPAEQAQYLDILKQKSRPYFLKAKVAEQKQNEIWNQSPALTHLLKDYATVRPELKRLLNRELQLLAHMPQGGSLQGDVKSALSEKTASLDDLFAARKTVAENPNNVKDIENLKILETKIGHPLMPSYLEARLNQLQRGKSL